MCPSISISKQVFNTLKMIREGTPNRTFTDAIYILARKTPDATETKKEEYWKVGETVVGYCICGCGEPIYFRQSHKSAGFPSYLKGHHIFGCISLPTGYEKKIITLARKYNLPFVYVGDNKKSIGKYNPDFISTDYRKLLIEVYSMFWRSRNGESEASYQHRRIKEFSKYGYRVLFLNDEDINNPNWEDACLNKIVCFCKDHVELEL